MSERLIAVLLSLVLVATYVLAYDETLEACSSGEDVVEATCNKLEASCIFPEDKMFTRRVAYVESRDGLDTDTCRTDYHGGIWQVGSAMFDLTKTSDAFQRMSIIYQNISNYFGISWSTVIWEDLRKPLYSALGARLYLQYQTLATHGYIPRSIPDQADHWKAHYRPAGNVSKFISGAESLIEESCSRGTDMVFVLDSSGSIGRSNWQKMLDFVIGVVNSTDIGLAKTRVGMVQYSTYVDRRFELNTYDNKHDIIDAVTRMPYMNSGTNTHLALHEMTNVSFTEVNGARAFSEGFPRIAIVVTDGESNEPDLTIHAAQRMHEADITAFAVGIGDSLNMDELKVIASQPTCMYLILLTAGFEEIDSLKDVIHKKSCEAPVILDPDYDETMIVVLPAGQRQNCQIKVTPVGATVELRPNQGTITFYTASSTYPSSAFYDNEVIGTSGSPAVLHIDYSSRATGTEVIVYGSVEGDPQLETRIEIDIRNAAVSKTTGYFSATSAIIVLLMNVWTQ